jgi:hypothetical protein
VKRVRDLYPPSSEMRAKLEGDRRISWMRRPRSKTASNPSKGVAFVVALSWPNGALENPAQLRRKNVIDNALTSEC